MTKAITLAVKKTTGQIIQDTIRELHDAEQVVTRQVLRDVTGLKMSIVDDHVNRLAEVGAIRRLVSGVFIPSALTPPMRAISVTGVPGGPLKVEVGDFCLDLWPREARLLGHFLAGHAQDFSRIQQTNEFASVAATLSEAVKNMARLQQVPIGKRARKRATGLKPAKGPAAQLSNKPSVEVA